MNRQRLENLIQLLENYLTGLPDSSDRDDLAQKLAELKQRKDEILAMFDANSQRVLDQQAIYQSEADAYLGVVQRLVPVLSPANKTFASRIKTRLETPAFRDGVANALAQGKVAGTLLAILKTLETFRSNALDEEAVRQRILEFQDAANQLVSFDERILKPTQEFLNQTIMVVDQFRLDSGITDPADSQAINNANDQFTRTIVEPFVLARQLFLADDFLQAASEINEVTEQMQQQLADLQALVQALQIIGGLLGIFNQVFALLA